MPRGTSLLLADGLAMQAEPTSSLFSLTMAKRSKRSLESPGTLLVRGLSALLFTSELLSHVSCSNQPGAVNACSSPACRMRLRAISRETFTLVTQEKSTQKRLITSYDMDFFCKMAVAFARIPKECVFGVLKDFRATTAQAQVHISSQRDDD